MNNPVVILSNTGGILINPARILMNTDAILTFPATLLPFRTALLTFLQAPKYLLSGISLYGTVFSIQYTEYFSVIVMAYANETMNTFWSNVKTCISKYVSFSGNSPRSEFWSWVMFVTVVSGVLFGAVAMLVGIRSLAGPDTASNPLNWFGSIIFPVFILLGSFLLFCLLPSLAVTVRRLRDAGYRPWIIIFPILLFIGAFYPALVVALSGMDTMPPEIPLPYCYAYLVFTAAVFLVYALFLIRGTKEIS